jgi:hypothetical protein
VLNALIMSNVPNALNLWTSVAKLADVMLQSDGFLLLFVFTNNAQNGTILEIYRKQEVFLLISKKSFVAGLLAGMVLAGTGAVYADSQISARLAQAVKIQLNGQEQPLPPEYAVLEYNDHTYVPARFLAERFGAAVGWDAENQTVLLSTPEHQSGPFAAKLADRNFLAHAVNGSLPGIGAKVGEDFKPLAAKWGAPTAKFIFNGGMIHAYPTYQIATNVYYGETADVQGALPITAIRVPGDQFNMTFGEIKSYLGKPVFEGPSQVTDQVVMLYEIGEYQIYIHANSPHTPATSLMLKKK